MTEREGQTPPDWALPGWDAVDPEEPVAVGPGRGVTPSDAPTELRPSAVAPGTFGLRILKVSDVTRAVRTAIRQDPRLLDLWVEGEIGRVTVSSAGHAYFALKDERNQLQSVWFRDERERSLFEAKAGLRVVVHGRIDLYEPTGAMQLYVDSIQPAGVGDLALRFEALKARLDAEGLFDSARKRPLPSRPRTIAVITSPSGAVWRDVSHVLARRWPLVQVVLVAAQVQGDGAPPSIVTAFRRVARYAAAMHDAGRPNDAPALTILARGGGSLEDLWAFNDERVVRAVVAHPLPVVCGVGHEVDVTLADFAADVRAPTPSAAAEIVVPDRLEMAGALRRAADRMTAATERRLAAAARDLAVERRALDPVSPASRLAAAREQVGLLFDRATRAVETRLAQERLRLAAASADLPRLSGARVAAARSALDASGAALSVLGPSATLERGYAIVRRTADGAIIRDPADAPGGSPLTIRVARGDIAATVDEPGQ
ncbi:MAG TPA: exodeoxyribonuclease VII large subunit [Candidatus Limnocylindrales bacterium]|nr:exodeoxyribonuclease VII large subunit [Candidatus Limnocylindrales bacterium]